MTEQNEKVNLLGLSPRQMESYFISLGEKKFRATQMLKWLHQKQVLDFDAMTDVSKGLRQRLNEIAEIRLPKVIKDVVSEDGTRKWLIEVDAGNAVEAVFIPEGDRGTLCVSSQVGCSLDCSFCSTGKQGFNRDLSAAEIIGQLWIARQALEPEPCGPGDRGKVSAAKIKTSLREGSRHADRRAVTNVVMMGMGEPLMNFDNVVAAMQLMLHDNAYGLSKRRVTLSTAGVVPALDRLAKEVDVSLAISLHAPNDELRNTLVPINKKYPISEFLHSAKTYIEHMPDNHRKITVEYTLIDHVNDRVEHAEQLAQLLDTVPCKINLIPFNPFSGSPYRRVSNNALHRFRDVLHQRGHTVTVRTTRGDDIAAACGQLAGAFNDRTKRSQRYSDKMSQNHIEPITIMGN